VVRRRRGGCRNRHGDLARCRRPHRHRHRRRERLRPPPDADAWSDRHAGAHSRADGLADPRADSHAYPAGTRRRIRQPAAHDNAHADPGADGHADPGSHRHACADTAADPGSDTAADPGSDRHADPGSDGDADPGTNRHADTGSDRHADAVAHVERVSQVSSAQADVRDHLPAADADSEPQPRPGLLTPAPEIPPRISGDRSLGKYEEAAREGGLDS
jgi:hypothetical protein